MMMTVSPTNSAFLRFCCCLSTFSLILDKLHVINAASLFPYQDLWSYHDSGEDVGDASWHTYFYNDTAWQMSYGDFGGGLFTYTTLNPTLAGETTLVTTYYFRKV
jgi:hypothetical protein